MDITLPHPNVPRPGWAEIAAGLATYIAILFILLLWIAQTPDQDPATRGNIGGAVNGVAGIAGLGAAYALRLRNLRAFGFRTTTRRWLIMGAALGLAAFGASFVIEGIYFHFITEANTQADLQAAAQGGALSLVILLFTGAILTPFGEEVLFRGVIAIALGRYGILISVIASALIFAAVHGPSVIFVLAFMVGVIAALVLHRTGSLWPGIVLHVTYNGLHLAYYTTL